MTQSFAEMLAETLEYVERALGRAEKGDGAETEAHNIRAYLVNTLELIDSDPDIDAAADELYATVATYVTAGCEPEDRGALHEALLRLEMAFTNARPSEKARHMGLA